ncbi:MAG: FecR domain-containing protein [Planctomycetota bacterium]|jgi:ferric-dicitrate binding protein FerR (iron transport regulator)
MDCEKYKKLIEKYIEGTISDEQVTELKSHTETCKPCKEEFEQCTVLEDVVREAFSSASSAEEGKASVMARLSAEPNTVVRRAQYNLGWLTGRRASIAAGILLAIGLTLGFSMGRASIDKPTGAKVPMRVTELDGTVLVRHEGLDAWQVLEADSTIHLGDTFHSTTKSAFVLEMEDKSTIEVNQNSMLVLKLYNGETQFFLEHGRCTAALESPHPPFFISTPHGRVEALGTEFTVTVE